jgi:hypothetical protein
VGANAEADARRRRVASAAVFIMVGSASCGIFDEDRLEGGREGSGFNFLKDL